MAVRPLRVTSCLADNASPLLDRLTTSLRSLHTAGIDVVVEPGLDPVDADVLFACGLLTRQLIDAGAPLDVVAAPVFPGEAAAVYRSVIVSRASLALDLESIAARQLAVNEYRSWSGWFALLVHLEARGLPSPGPTQRVETGSHAASLAAVSEGEVDVAAIDSSVWRHLRANHPDLEVIATTRDWPAPPVSVSPTVDAAARHALLSTAGFLAAGTATYDEMAAEAARLS